MTRRRPVARRLVAAAAAILALVALAPRAIAGEPLPAEARARAESDFVWGRLERLDATLGASAAPVDLEALAVRDLFWRPMPGALERIPAAAFDASLPGRRLAWLRAYAQAPDTEPAAYPLPRAGETDAWPRLTALVLDRIEREGKGVALPEVGRALLATHDPDLEWFVKEFLARTGVPTATDGVRPAPAPASAHRTANLWLAIASVTGLLALGAGLWCAAMRADRRWSVGGPAIRTGAGLPRP